MGKLYFNQLVPNAVSALSAAVNFPASNVALQSIEQEWRSNHTVDLIGAVRYDFGAPKLIAGVLVNSTNADSVVINGLNNIYGFIGQYASKQAADSFGRSRVLCAPNQYMRAFDFYPSAFTSGLQSLAYLRFAATAQGSEADKFINVAILNPNHLVAAGSVLRYEFWVEPSNPAIGAGALNLTLTGGAPADANSAGVVDQNGTQIALGPTGSAGTWLTRTLSLTPIVGRTIASVLLANNADATGSYAARYRNIRITDAGGGNVLLPIWAGGAPSVFTVLSSVGFYGATYTAQGAPTDGVPYWRIGAMYAFGNVATIKNPDHGVQIKTDHAESYNELPNKQISRAQIGTRHDRWSGRFMLTDTTMLAPLLSAMRSGVFAIDFEHADYPWAMQPLRCMEPQDVVTFSRPGGTEVQFSAIEVV